MKHGPIALIDEHMPVVFIAAEKDILYQKIKSNMEEVKARKGKIIADIIRYFRIYPENHKLFTKLWWTNECYQSMINVTHN